MTSDDRHEAVEVARLRADLSVQRLWLRYVALGGSCDAFDVDGYLQGLMPLDAFQEDVLAQAVNEALEELYRSLRVPLSASTTSDGAVESALAKVVEHLLASRKDGPGQDLPSAGGEGRPPAGPLQPEQ